MATLVEKLEQKENAVRELIEDEEEREERLITEYGKIFDEYEHHPLVWRVMSGKTTFESDIEENLVKRYKSRFKKYIFDRPDRDFSRTVSLYKHIYPNIDAKLDIGLDNVMNLITLGIMSYLIGKVKEVNVNSLLEEARHLDSVCEKVKKSKGG